MVQQIYPSQYDETKDGLNSANPVNTYSDSNVGDRFTYDSNGNMLTHIDSENNAATNVYNSDNKIIKSVYNNNDITRYIYDSNDNLIQKINPDQYDPNKDGLNGSVPQNSYSDPNVGDRYTYDTDGNVLTHIDSNNKTTSYAYNSNDAVEKCTQPDGSVFNYDNNGHVISEQYSNGDIRTYKYNNDGSLSNITNSNNFAIQFGYNSNQDINSLVQTFGSNINNMSYTYDAYGNIITISESGNQKVKYYYDNKNELTREDNVWQNQTITYSYDQNGNLLKRNIYSYTSGDLGNIITSYNYEYNNQNQLINYNGRSITYDSNGNIQNYNGWIYSWDNKYKLSSITNGNNTITYHYNYNGIRTDKTVNGVTTIFTLNGNIVTSQDDGKNKINFTYDSFGKLVYMNLNGTTYYYEKDINGDIIGLVDTSGNRVVTYSYDSWGNLLSIGGALSNTVGVLNPFRYREYYYDTETGLYYVTSRYYNPEIERFISKDDPTILQLTWGDVLGSNLYAYCRNNPVMNSDPNGNLSIPGIAAIIKGLTNLAGFAWDSRQGIWYSLQNCWQRKYGYCEEFNKAAPFVGIIIKNKPIDFKYSGKSWRIWLWKGLYDITTGAEIGIYIYYGHKTLSYRGVNYTIDDWYRSADDSERLSMSFTLYKNGKPLFSRSDYTWWLTGFKPGMSFWWDTLCMHISITFPNTTMRNAFCKGFGIKIPSSNKVSFTW